MARKGEGLRPYLFKKSQAHRGLVKLVMPIERLDTINALQLSTAIGLLLALFEPILDPPFPLRKFFL